MEKEENRVGEKTRMERVEWGKGLQEESRVREEAGRDREGGI